MEYIYEAHNILPKTFCKEMIEKFESDSRKAEGELLDGFRVFVDTTMKKRTDLNLETNTGWKLECNRIGKAFRTAFRNYQNNLKLNVFGEDKAHIVDQLFVGKNVVRNSLTFRKYQVGDYFKWHVDYNHSADRICNFIIYLNDHEACTEFLNGKKIKPETGKIVFFPTTWVHAHRGQTIEKGAKYMVTSFIHYDDINERYIPPLL